MRIRELFDKVGQEIELDIILHQIEALVVQKILGSSTLPYSWGDMQIPPEGATTILEVCILALTDWAGTMSVGKASDDLYYETATEIAKAVHRNLSAAFAVQLPEPCVVPYTQLAAEAGVVEIFEKEGGQKFVRLTPEGEESIERMLSAEDN